MTWKVHCQIDVKDDKEWPMMIIQKIINGPALLGNAPPPTNERILHSSRIWFSSISR